MKKHLKPTIAFALSLACGLLFCLPAVDLHAQFPPGDTINWDNTTGGNFNDVNNWQGGVVPGEDDAALFGSSANGTYTVTFTDAQTTVTQILVSGGTTKNITFNMGGNTVTAIGTDTTAHQGAIDMRATATTGPMTLRLENGLLKSGFLAIGERGSQDSVGATLVVGGDATLESSAGGRIGDRSSQKATIRVEDGGTWDHGINTSASNRWFYLGRSAGTDGNIIVDGVGSTVDFKATNDVSATLIVGDGGDGTIEVLNGGSFVNAGLVRLSSWSSFTADQGTGTLRVEGTNSEFATTDGRDIQAGREGDAFVIVKDGGDVRAAGTLELAENGTLDIDNGTASATGAVVFVENSIYNLTLHDPDTSPLDSGTNFSLANSVPLNLALGSGFAPQVGDEFILFSYGGDLTGTAGQFDGLPQDALINIGVYEFRIDYGSGTDSYAFLEVTAIPEPGTLAMVCMLGLTLILRRRHNAGALR